MYRVFLMVWTVWNAGSAAVNGAFYAEDGAALSLAAAIFCGLMFVVSAALYVRED